MQTSIIFLDISTISFSRSYSSPETSTSVKHRGGDADLESQLYASFTLSFLSFALMTEMLVFMGFSSVHHYSISEIHGYFLDFFFKVNLR